MVLSCRMTCQILCNYWSWFVTDPIWSGLYAVAQVLGCTSSLTSQQQHAACIYKLALSIKFVTVLWQVVQIIGSMEHTQHTGQHLATRSYRLGQLTGWARKHWPVASLIFVKRPYSEHDMEWMVVNSTGSLHGDTRELLAAHT